MTRTRTLIIKTLKNKLPAVWGVRPTLGTIELDIFEVLHRDCTTYGLITNFQSGPQ